MIGFDTLVGARTAGSTGGFAVPDKVALTSSMYSIAFLPLRSLLALALATSQVPRSYDRINDANLLTLLVNSSLDNTRFSSNVNPLLLDDMAVNIRLLAFFQSVQWFTDFSTEKA